MTSQGMMTGVTEMYLVPVVRSNHPLLMLTNKYPPTSPQLNGIQTQVIFLYYCTECSSCLANAMRMSMAIWAIQATILKIYPQTHGHRTK